MTKLDALNTIKVVDFDCCNGEVEYVIAELNAGNIKTLLDAGFTPEQIDDAMGFGKTDIDLATLAFCYAGANYWTSSGGFTSSVMRRLSD